MKINYKLADQSDLEAIIKVGYTLFDNPVIRERAEEFLQDPRHHLYLVYDEGNIVGMASGVHYVHPDKEPEFFINEAGVLETHRNKGIARVLIQKLVQYAKENLNCASAWVLTDDSNLAAQKVYLAAGGKKDGGRIVLIEF